MKKRTVDLVLTIIATVGALLLSGPYWWHTDHWLNSQPWRAVYFVVGAALVLYVIYAVLTAIRKLLQRNASGSVISAEREKSDWPILAGILSMAFAFVLSGIVEVFNYHVPGLDGLGIAVGLDIAPYTLILLIFCPVLIIGAGMIGLDLFGLKHRASSSINSVQRIQPITELRSNYPATGWSRYLVDKEPDESLSTTIGNHGLVACNGCHVNRFEIGLWLLAFWISGGIIAVSLLGLDFLSVPAGYSTLSYVLRAAGYTGVFFITILFSSRFVAAIHGQRHTGQHAT